MEWFPRTAAVLKRAVEDGAALAIGVRDRPLFRMVLGDARIVGGVSGNAGLFSGLDDMEVFASMLACGGKHRGGSFLAPCTLSAAIRCHTPGMAQNRGLGFHLSGPGSFHGDLFPPSSYGHTGFTGTSLLVDPESGLYMVLLSNRVHPTRESTRFLHTRRAVHNAAMAEFSRLSAQIQGGISR